ncbi:hypothetical protein F4778DRAFT_735624 [Xylariomycetidae sp. FL2044]|nr:hypothetical protein F4778DRAFT_735624 [Xylariomycetidae sp. FL2044]
MAYEDSMTIEKPAADLLETRKAVRVVILLRKKSPLFSKPPEQVVLDTCSFLKVPQEESRLVVIQKELRWLDILAVDLFYHDYDFETAHIAVDLPVLIVDYGKRSSVVKRSVNPDFRKEVNRKVADQHDCHGWFAQLPLVEDRTCGKVPTYYHPRSCKYRNPEDDPRNKMKKKKEEGEEAAALYLAALRSNSSMAT